MKTDQILNHLQSLTDKSSDEDFIEDFKIIRFDPVLIDEVRKVEEKKKFKLPNSYIDHVTKHGTFHIGDLELWPVSHLNTGLNELGSEVGVNLAELGVEKCSEEISNILAIPKADIKAFDNFILFATYYSEEHYAFDLRTKNPKTGESECIMIDFHDVEDMANDTYGQCQNRSFDYYIYSFIKKRMKSDYPEYLDSFITHSFSDT